MNFGAQSRVLVDGRVETLELALLLDRVLVLGLQEDGRRRERQRDARTAEREIDARAHDAVGRVVDREVREPVAHGVLPVGVGHVEQHAVGRRVDGHAGELGALGRAQAGRRLVETEQLRLGGQRPRQFEAALLGHGEVGGRHFGARAETAEFERFARERQG